MRLSTRPDVLWPLPFAFARALTLAAGLSAASVTGMMMSAAPAHAATSGADAPSVDPLDRARLREMLLTERSSEADDRARANALAAYRLLRRRSASYLTAPERRGEDGRAWAAAAHLLRRSAGEARAWRQELARTVAEREALEAAAIPAIATDPPGDFELAEATEADEAAETDARMSPLHPPARGTRMASPGIRLDAPTGAERRLAGLEILARLNEPVHAVTAGVVHRIEALPQGGFALVVSHADTLVSIVSGLRRVDVAVGQAVERGQVLGLTGRNLDGAPVLLVELWQNGAPVDPRALLASPSRTAHPARKLRRAPRDSHGRRASAGHRGRPRL